MKDFIDAAYQLRESGNNSDQAAFDLVFDLIQNRLSRLHAKSSVDLRNIESVFSLIEMARLVKRLPDSDLEDIGAASEAMRVVLADTLEQSCRFRVSGDGWLPPLPYLSIAGLVDPLQHTASGTAFITFNYDVGLDFALHWLNLALDYGLKPVHGQSALVLKLHGSLNWGICPKCSEIIPARLEDGLPRISSPESRTLPISTRRALAQVTHCGERIPSRPALVPPSWNKTQYHEKFSAIWSRAAMELAEAQEITVIGYSLPDSDAFFRDLLALGIAGPAPVRKFTVVDPSDETSARFTKLLGPDTVSRFEHVKKTFEEYSTEDLPVNSRLLPRLK